MANRVDKLHLVLKIKRLGVKKIRQIFKKSANVVIAISCLDLNETRSERSCTWVVVFNFFLKNFEIGKVTLTLTHSPAYGFPEIGSLWDSVRMFGSMIRDMSRMDLFKKYEKLLNYS